MSELVWTRQESGNYVANHGGWAVVKMVKAKIFELHRFGNTVFRNRGQKIRGTLGFCKSEAQILHEAEEKKASTILGEFIPEQEISEPDPLLILADDGNPNHEPVDEPEPVVNRPMICPGVACKCERIGWGMTCPAHGRKLRGGIATGSRWI